MQETKIWTVSEINSTIRSIIESSISPFWLKGEVGTLNIHRSGHVYMTLKDKKTQVKAVFFGGADQARRMNLQVGNSVEVSGRITVYEVRGEYQISVTSIRPMGIGDLQRRFEELKQKLYSEGLFDENRKKPLPLLPSKIGVVTSADGAAIRDFLQIITRRFPNLTIKIYPAAVQGKGAERQVARGIDFFNMHNSVDVIIVTRGGGSMEDLWPFNEEILARSIAASHIPVVSAVGHEIDYTISDFVADMRVPTPSAAAELVIGHQESFTDLLKNSKRRMCGAMELILHKYGRRYEVASNSYVFREPAHMIREKQQHIDELTKDMEHIITNSYEASRNRYNLLSKELKSSITRNCQGISSRIEQLKGKLTALSPIEVIKRGYSIITDESGSKLITSPDIPANSKLKAVVAKGVLELTYIKGEIKEITESEINLS